jgi:hypothetical protein
LQRCIVDEHGYTGTLWDSLTPSSRYPDTPSAKVSKKICWLYSQRANHIIFKKNWEFVKLIKRFRYLQAWLKSSDI